MLEHLKEIGLTENEAQIYLALLKHGPLNPTKLSEITGQHRSYTYDTLERLLHRGFITTIQENGRKFFKAQDPTVLYESINQKLVHITSILPELQQLYSEKLQGTEVTHHRGKRVYRILIKDILAHIRENEEVLLIGVSENFLLDVEPIYLKQYLVTIKEKNVSERIIIAKGEKIIKEEHLQYRELDPQYFGKMTICIFQNKVYQFLWEDPLQLIITESETMADAYRLHFEFLWKKAKS